MSQVGTGGAKTGGRRVRVTAKAKPASTAPPRTPDQSDRATKPRTPPAPVKYRAFAHPQRPEPQKVIKRVVRQAEQEKAQRTEFKQTVGRVRVTPVPSPDARDSTRSPAQRARDADVVAKNVRDSREKYLGKAGRGAGIQVVKAATQTVGEAAGREAKHALAPITLASEHAIPKGAAVKVTAAAGREVKHALAPITLVAEHAPKGPKRTVARIVDKAFGRGTVAERARKREGKGGGPVFATVGAGAANALTPLSAVTEHLPGKAGEIARNAGLDAMELAVTTPSSVTKLAATGATEPEKVPGMLVKPYTELYHHPGREIVERPVSSALLAAPVVRVPGRAVGRVARVKGRQSLERPDASLPGTALKVTRTGSRDYLIRKGQERKDRANPAPLVTEVEIKRRVDAHAEHQRQLAQDREAEAVRRAKRAHPRGTAGRDTAIRDARTTSRAQSREHQPVAFAEEFGANVRPSTGHAVKVTAKATRDAALTDLNTIRGPIKAAAKAEVRTATAKLNRELAKPVAKRKGVATLTTQVARARQTLKAATGKGIPPADLTRLIGQTPDPLMRTLLTGLGTRRAGYATAKTAYAAIKARPVTLIDAQPTGRLFDHKQDARTVANQLNATPPMVKRGGKTPTALQVHDPAAPGLPAAITRAPSTVPIAYTIRKVGDKYMVAPKVARDRMYPSKGPDAPLSQQAVGSSKATGAKLMRTTRGLMTNALLPASLKWLGGQAGEATVRSIVAGAGPFDILRFHKTKAEMNRQVPGSGDAMATRMTGANATLVSGAARDFAHGKSLAEEFRGGPKLLEQGAAAATKAGRTLPARAVRATWKGYTTLVLDDINGFIENTARQAMAGHAIKHGPLMEDRVLGNSDAAIRDAAAGLQNTPAQVRLLGDVDRMYGRYKGFSPELRTGVLHWTPFLPWTLNVLTFLGKVLPLDHPVLTSLIVSASEATEQWRKDNRLSLRGEGHLPAFMLGSYPDGKGGYRPVGKYTPMGITDATEGAAGLILPQASTPLLNLRGVSYTGDRLKYPGYAGREFNTEERIIRALVSAVEAQAPLVAVAGRVSGVTPRVIDKKTEIPPLGERLKKELPGHTMKSSPVPSSGGSSSSALPIRVTRPRRPRPPRPTRPARPHR